MQYELDNGCAVIRCWQYADGGNEGVSTHAPESRRKNFRTEREMFLWEEYFAPGEEIEVYDNGVWGRYRVTSDGKLQNIPMISVRKTRIVWNDEKTMGVRTYYFEEVPTPFTTSPAAEFYTNSRRINSEYMTELAMRYFGCVPSKATLIDLKCGRFHAFNQVQFYESAENCLAIARLMFRQLVSPDYFLTVEGNFAAYQDKKYSSILK